MLTTTEQKIWDLIEAGVEDMNLRLVRVRITGGSGQNTVQVMIEPQESTAQNMVSVTLEECEAVSRMASAIMDVEDPITNKYHLEVSSTGIERPLVKEEDFNAYAGRRAKVEMQFPIDNRRRFFGVLKGMEENGIAMTTDEGESTLLPYESVKFAHLALTDDEINEMMKAVKE